VTSEAIITFVIQGLLGLVIFFGGMWVRDLAQAVKDLRMEDQKLSERQAASDRAMSERMSNYVHKDEFREFRIEQRELFNQMFEKLDDVKDSLARKVDRTN
jgi:hypothetical protein